MLPTLSGCGRGRAPRLGWSRNKQLALSAVRVVRLAAAGQAQQSRGSLHPRSEGTPGTGAQPAWPG
ncbi:hypothetical protein I79_000603 [Cricetulus griseus]|uniref:Uncharacterized protein n=1 Tax=Cricetulus griseus TaxID=10029 RepID=G3GSI8_CRIGR|nr:hypothetical protein I79_000603 [Cricetulus griseus]